MGTSSFCAEIKQCSSSPKRCIDGFKLNTSTNLCEKDDICIQGKISCSDPQTKCELEAHEKYQGLTELESRKAMYELSCRPHLFPCDANNDCCSGVCANFKDEGKFCIEKTKCQKCVAEKENLKQGESCCEGLMENEGVCVKFINVPSIIDMELNKEDPLFDYKINSSCGIEWKRPEVMNSIYEAEYWMAAFEFIFMNNYPEFDKDKRGSDLSFLTSFMGFNTNNVEIAKALFLLRSPIDNIYTSRINQFKNIINLEQSNIDPRSQSDFFYQISYIFLMNADRAREKAYAYEYILPLFDRSFKEIESHYWGNYQGKTLADNPRNNEEGDYDKKREAGYNICSKPVPHISDEVCTKSCLKLAFDLSSDEDLYFSKLIDPIIPKANLKGSALIKAESVCKSGEETYGCDNSVYNNIKNHNKSNEEDLRLALCDQKNLLNVQGFDNSLSLNQDDVWRTIKIKKPILRQRIRDTSKDPKNSDICLKEDDGQCKWYGEVETCKINAQAVLLRDESDDISSTGPIISTNFWNKNDYPYGNYERLLFDTLTPIYNSLDFSDKALIMNLVFPAFKDQNTNFNGLNDLIRSHSRNLAQYNYKSLSKDERNQFKKELEESFLKYAKKTYIKFSKLPNPNGTFTASEGMDLAKAMLFQVYLEAFTQGHSNKGKNPYSSECHWENHGHERLQFLKKTLGFAILLRNFYSVSEKAWTEVSQCINQIPQKDLSLPLSSSSSEKTDLTGNSTSGVNSKGVNNSSTENSNSGSNSISQNGQASPIGVSGNSNYQTQSPASLISTKMKDQSLSSSFSSSTPSSGSGEAKSKNISSNLASSRKSGLFSRSNPLLKRKDNFNKVYGSNKKYMDKIENNFQNFLKDSPRRLEQLGGKASLNSSTVEKFTNGSQSKNTFPNGALSNKSIDGQKQEGLNQGLSSAGQTGGSFQSSLSARNTKQKSRSINSINQNQNQNQRQGIRPSTDFNDYAKKKEEDFNKNIHIKTEEDEVSLFELIEHVYRKNIDKLNE